MASKKNKKDVSNSERTMSSADYYKLKTKAVDDLVNADAQNAPVVSEEELKKYRSKSRFQLPEWLKAVLIKLWFGGAVCFFVMWGLGMYLHGLDMIFVLGLALGIVTDLLVNNIFRFYESTPGANDRWMMFPKRKFANLFLNIIYCFVILFGIYTLYNLIFIIVGSIKGTEEEIVMGVEPILFGVFYMGFDMLFIGMKRMFLRIVEDAKNSAKK